MPYSHKAFPFLKGKKETGRGDRQAAADTSSATATISSEKETIGLFELSTAEASMTVDVVAVHGLQGDAFKTWEDSNGTLWLRDLLPEHVPNARIMTFGYDSTIAFSNSAARLEDKALDLLNRLGAQRDENTQRRPVVFICHSLGGIVVKKALVLAHERSSDAVYKDILINTMAISFLGVPHKGADGAWWANFAANALKGASIGLTTNNALVADLRKDSSALSTISKQFIDKGRDLSIYTFYERLKLKGFLVVDEQSARLNLPNEKVFPVDADHRTICKMSSREDQIYQVVGVWIAKLIRAQVERGVPLGNDPMTISKSLVGLLKANTTLSMDNKKLTLLIPIFASPEYVQWNSGETKEILWYRGVPGCGKSTMISQLLKGLFEDLAFTEAVAFFDFNLAWKRNSISANIPAAVILFIVAQLLEHDPTLLSAVTGDEQKIITTALFCTYKLFAYEASSESESHRVIPGLVSALRMIQESTLWSCLRHIIDRGLETMSRIYLVFDGDDNALPEDRFRFLRNIRKLWEHSECTQSGCVKVLIASRDYPKAREVLVGLPYLDDEKEQQANARMSLIGDGEKNTGKWILTDSQYRRWRNEPGSALLWLQGNPGTGKSTLMKQIQHQLSNEDGLPKAVVASFYYSAREGKVEINHTHMLQALLYQILLQETRKTYPFFRSVFRAKREQMQPWRFEEMRSIFVSLSRSHPDSLRCFLLLDALDESDKGEIQEVISLLEEVTTSEAELKVLVASRPGPIISSRLRGSAYHLILEDKNKKDIEAMIASSIGFLRKSDRTTFEWMSSYILSRARGVFIWVSLIVSDIKRLVVDDGWSEAELKAEVEALPDSLVPYYKRITSRLALQELARVGEGIRMLRWVVHSERPLNIAEFRDAVATSHLNTLMPPVVSTSTLYDHRLKRLEHVSKRLMRNCGELVEVKHPVERAVGSDVDPRDVVQLFHETVGEFLKDPTRAAAPFDMEGLLGHAEIAVVCARYIRMALTLDRRYIKESRSSSPTDDPSPWSYETHRMFAQQLSDRPLLPYALKFLPRHMNFLKDREQAKTSCVECFNDLDSDHELFFLSSWLQTSFQPPSSSVDADEAAQFRVCSLVAAADQGLATAVESLIELQTTLDAVEGTTNHSALQIASQRGHLDIVDILIKSEASVNFHCSHFGTALQAAAYSGRQDIVNTLLASGADPNSESGYLLRPFFSACCMGHYSSAKALRMAGADPNPPDGLFRNIWDPDELKKLVKNLERCIDLEDRLASFLSEAAVQFINMGQMSNAEEMYRRALEGGERVLGLEHPDTLISVGKLASVLGKQGKYAAAEEMCRRALEARERELGVEHPNTLSSLEYLALVLREQGEMCRRALKGSNTLSSVGNLPWVLREQEIMRRPKR